jgi:hypothetical protein
MPEYLVGSHRFCNSPTNVSQVRNMNIAHRDRWPVQAARGRGPPYRRSNNGASIQRNLYIPSALRLAKGVQGQTRPKSDPLGQPAQWLFCTRLHARCLTPQTISEVYIALPSSAMDKQGRHW